MSQLYSNHDLIKASKLPKQKMLTTNSAKITKGDKYGWLSGVLYLSPARRISATENTCSHHTKGCARACNSMSGRQRFNARVRLARLKRLLENPGKTAGDILVELESLIRKGARENAHGVALRLNGTTDLRWGEILFDGKSLLEWAHGMGIRTYDYTKNPKMARDFLGSNHHVTYSYNESSDPVWVSNFLDDGGNVAVVFYKKLPDYWEVNGKNYKVINGDDHDLRFLDPRGVIVGLKYKEVYSGPKGKAKSVDIGKGFIHA